MNIKKLSIAALILLVVGVAGSLLTFKSMTKTVTVSEQRVMEHQDITDILVTSDNSQIEIIPTKETNIIVELSGKIAKTKKHTFEAETEGQTLKVRLREIQRKFPNFGFFTGSLVLKVYVPEKTYDVLDVQLANGRVKARELDVKSAQVSTINGRIELQNIQTSNIEISSQNGQILLDEVEGDMKGSVTNGSISLKTGNLTRPISLDSVNGKITVITDKEPENVTFDVNVTNGNVNIFGKTTKSALIGNGENLIRLSTVNGSINVKK